MMSIGIARSTPPTSQLKVSNFQRNGNVQATLEEQIIEAAKRLYVLRYRNNSTDVAIGEAYARLDGLNAASHQLSANARQYIKCASDPIVPGSKPAEIMWDAFK